MSSAAIVIIGNEILSGKYRDDNSPWLAVRLRELGVDLGRITVIPDDIDLIARTVRELSESFDHVFTTGGVGPTHDDMTMEGVARAFGVDLVREPRLEALVRQHLKGPVTAAALRMADVPTGTELWDDGEIRFPQVVMRNVVVFPGVPALLRMKFDAIAHRFEGVPVRSARLVSTDTESAIAATLTSAQERWPTVDIGSYPRFESKPYTVVVTMDSRAPDDLAACRDHLAQALAAHLVEPPPQL